MIQFCRIIKKSINMSNLSNSSSSECSWTFFQLGCWFSHFFCRKKKSPILILVIILADICCGKTYSLSVFLPLFFSNYFFLVLSLFLFCFFWITVLPNELFSFASKQVDNLISLFEIDLLAISQFFSCFRYVVSNFYFGFFFVNCFVKSIALR